MQRDEKPERLLVVHPAWLRLCHWVNAAVMVIMTLSGWRIYNASPLFSFYFPGEITLGGWLGGALQWHFAAMWIFAGNGVLYLTMNVVTGRFRKKFLPLSLRGLLHDASCALKGKLAHADLRHYNPIQRAAYLFVMLDCLLLVLSGLVLWKSVQFGVLRDLLGGYEAARYIHFYAMAALVGFVMVHLLMVALVPKTLLAMLRGR
ncbi:cytochrome b/b6 domain-containing protein [Pantoea sp. BIGb0393]|uniref:Cytochrome b/b6 domain-containing protein n=1 Tax=Pantoea nemavictus TaxID=2726955 RepID=A0ABU8PS11_9GAMM|nr:cytochrome b/b6 domain-containing protein [Pantoea nemavictus]MBA0036495.1 cytochrome b/b6 domain-containing protein [Pantoea nemavictus]